MLEDYRNEIGSLWIDGWDNYYLIIDVYENKHMNNRPEFIIERTTNGDRYENEVNDFYTYHSKIS
jgi:hypothetical protein